MLSLSTATFPSSAADLQRLLNEALDRSFISKSEPVTVSDHAYPRVSGIQISLDEARLRPDPPRPPIVAGEVSPALEIEQLTLSASPLFLGSAGVNLSGSAREVHLAQGKDSNGQLVLSIDKVANGQMEISIAHAELEAVITELAQTKGATQGITINNLQLKLQEKSPRAVSAEVQFRVRKLILSASIRVTGQIDLDDELNLKVSGLACSGEGGTAALVCGLLKPYLQKVDGREFPLMSLPLGKIQLRDVRLTVGERLTVFAEFGSAAQSAPPASQI